MDQVKRFKVPTSETTILLMEIERERARMARLQAIVDQAGEHTIKSLNLHTVASVVEARSLYDMDWFDKQCPYSSELKRRLAQALLDATRKFASMIDTTVWTKIAEGH